MSSDHDEVKIIRASDWRPDPPRAHATEASYRRGFDHGINYAIRLLQAGGNLSDLCKYEGAVYRWRVRSSGTGYLPPTPVPLEEEETPMRQARARARRAGMGAVTTIRAGDNCYRPPASLLTAAAPGVAARVAARRAP